MAAPPQPQQPQYAPQAAPPPQPPQYAPPTQQYPAPQQPPQYAPPAQPQYAPPPQQQYAPPPQQQYAPPPAQPVYTIAEPKKGMPAWLVGVLTIAVLGGALFGLYRFVGGRGSTSNADATATKLPAAGASKNPYSKYLEVVGVRLFENDAKKAVVRFTVVNHSPAEIAGLELQVVLKPVDSKPETEPVSVIDAKVGSVPANGTKEFEALLNTKMKIYELPDWQFLKTDFVVTAPN